MNSSHRHRIKTRFDFGEVRTICGSSLLVLIFLLPTLGAYGQDQDEGFAACAQQMTDNFAQKGWVGITPTYDQDGIIRVDHVFADSPAAKAGMRKGDLVRGINGRDRKTAKDEFMKEYDSLRPNQVTVFDLEREGRRLSVSVLVEPIPESVLKRWIQEECQ